MLTRRTLLAASALALGVGCQREPAHAAGEMSYLAFGTDWGLDEAIQMKLFEEGQLVEHFVVDDDGRHVGHARVIIGEQTYDADAAGRVRLPMSRALLRRDGLRITIFTHEPINAYLHYQGTVRFTCDGSTAGRPLTLSSLRIIELGPDRLYVEDRVNASLDAAKRLLPQQRELLRRRLGVEPPPCAVAIVRELVEGSNPVDDGRRFVWTVTEAELSHEKTLIGTVTHEWAHSAMDGWFSGGVASWAEEGLCERIGHEAMLALAHDKPRDLVQSHARALAKRVRDLEHEVNLWHFAAVDNTSVGAYLRSACGNERYLGYPLALAFWLSFTAEAYDEMIGRLRTGRLANDGNLNQMLERLGPRDDLSFSALQPRAALGVLRAHAHG